MSIKSFQRRMQAIPKAAREAALPAVQKSADEMAEMMRALAPERLGDLKASIAVTGPGQFTPAYSHPGGSQRMAENAFAVTVGNTDVRYPHLQEYGTTRHDPQPFFWPAYRLLKKRSERRIKRAIGKGIKEAWNR